jgi:hypothetical protein
MVNLNAALKAKIVASIWVAQFDVDDTIRRRSEILRTRANFQPTPIMCQHILQAVTRMCEPVCTAGAAALADALRRYPAELEPITKKMLDLYFALTATSPPVMYDFGGEIAPAVWEPRAGILMAFHKLNSS